MLVDSHCHLDPRHFPEGPDAVLGRAHQAGVDRFVVIGVDADGGAAVRAVELAERRKDVWAAVGQHPHDAALVTDELFARLAELATAPRVVAIGEVGLDYHYLHSPKPEQAEVFRRMIDLAKHLRKPLVIHTRSAPDDTLAILREEGARDVGGIIHCFSEDRAFAERALDLDFDLSFSGIVTFKNAGAIQDVARFAPSERILVETDSPYLAPLPLRGRKNEPCNVVHTARFIAELRGSTAAEISQKTSENAIRRLGLGSLS
jgi:TatD DNase family protein